MLLQSLGSPQTLLPPSGPDSVNPRVKKDLRAMYFNLLISSVSRKASSSVFYGRRKNYTLLLKESQTKVKRSGALYIVSFDGCFPACLVFLLLYLKIFYWIDCVLSLLLHTAYVLDLFWFLVSNHGPSELGGLFEVMKCDPFRANAIDDCLQSSLSREAYGHPPLDWGQCFNYNTPGVLVIGDFLEEPPLWRKRGLPHQE